MDIFETFQFIKSNFGHSAPLVRVTLLKNEKSLNILSNLLDPPENVIKLCLMNMRTGKF